MPRRKVDAPAEEPKVDAPAEVVAFASEAPGLIVWDAEHDCTAAQFVDGVFATDDPRVIAILEATDGVVRK